MWGRRREEERRGIRRGSAPDPGRGRSPLHPVANEAVEIVQNRVPQILAAQKWLARLWVRILAPEAQSYFR